MPQDPQTRRQDIDLELALGFAQTRACNAEKTLDEYDRRVEAALLELLRRRHSNDTELCQGCEKCRATLDTSQPESPSTQATGAETGDLQRPLISSCKHEDEPVNFVVTLRDIENAFGPILQWRHRCWPDDSSYTFVTTEDSTDLRQGPEGGWLGMIMRAVKAEAREAKAISEAEKAKSRVAELEEHVAKSEKRSRAQLQNARIFAYQHISGRSKCKYSPTSNALHLYIRVSVQGARYLFTCFWEWILDVCSRFAHISAPAKFNAPRLIV